MIWQIFCIIETAQKSVGKTCSCCVLLHNQSPSVKLKKRSIRATFFSIYFQARLLFQGEIEKWTVNLRKYAWKLLARFISKPNGETGQGSGYYFDGSRNFSGEPAWAGFWPGPSWNRARIHTKSTCSFYACAALTSRHEFHPQERSFFRGPHNLVF